MAGLLLTYLSQSFCQCITHCKSIVVVILQEKTRFKKGLKECSFSFLTPFLSNAFSFFSLTTKTEVFNVS